MLEILEFIFSSFWRWLGTVILVSSIMAFPVRFLFVSSQKILEELRK